MTRDEAMEAAVAALAENISEQIPEQNYEHTFVAQIVLDAIGFDELTIDLKRLRKRESWFDKQDHTLKEAHALLADIDGGKHHSWLETTTVQAAIEQRDQARADVKKLRAALALYESQWGEYVGVTRPFHKQTDAALAATDREEYR